MTTYSETLCSASSGLKTASSMAASEASVGAPTNVGTEGLINLQTWRKELDETKLRFEAYEVCETWPNQYYNRFQKWMTRKLAKKYERTKDMDFITLTIEYPVFFAKNVRNWDSTLKKAILKDEIVEKNRQKLKRWNRESRKAPGFVKAPLVDPKTRHVQWKEIAVHEDSVKLTEFIQSIDERIARCRKSIECDENIISLLEQEIARCTLKEDDWNYVPRDEIDGARISLDKTPSGQNMQLRMMVGSDVLAMVNLPQVEAGITLTLPISESEWYVVHRLYTYASPFFRSFLAWCKQTMGDTYMSIVNKFLMTSQYKRGEPEYYKDQVFGTRNRRDKFVDFMEKEAKAITESCDCKSLVCPICTRDNASMRTNAIMQSTGQSAIDLEETAEISKSTNITFVDERPIDQNSVHTGNEVFAKDPHKDIAENNWSLNDILTREYPFKQLSWGVSDSGEIYSVGLPAIITEDATCMITKQLSFFSFMRAGIKVRVQVNGTKFHCGRLIVYFKPLSWDNEGEENYASVTCYPHFFLDASVSNSGELEIPFTHLLSHFSQETDTLSTNSINSLGALKIYVFNALQTAEGGSNAISVQVYASLINPEVHLPTSGITKFSYSNGVMQGKSRGVEGLLKGVAGSAINTGLNLADKFTGGLVTGAGDALCNLLGICDKPSDPVSAAPMINRSMAPLAHGAGLDRSVRLGLSPVAQTNTDPALLGSTDGDFNILKLCQIPCRVGQFVWNETNKSGDKLYDMLVSPVWCDVRTDLVSNMCTAYQLSMLAYVSRGFCYWRGSLKVKVQVIATQFHSGRLALVFDPHGTSKINLDKWENNKSHNIVMVDIQEKQEIVVELPYFSVKPWLRCDKIRTSDTKAGKDSDCWLDADVAGMFRIFVVNDLVRPTNVTDKVDVNVFLYAGDNFELAVPNPVAPFSFTQRPSSSKPLVPMYPWTKDSDFFNSVLCGDEYRIYSLWKKGKELFEKGMVALHPYQNKQYPTRWWWLSPSTKSVAVYNWYYEVMKMRADYNVMIGQVTNCDNPGQNLCYKFMCSLPEYAKQIPKEEEKETTNAIMQSAESYTTTRDSEGEAILMTSANVKRSVAPGTLSENSMNMQTLLRRFYPLVVSQDLIPAQDFTLITIPVSPTALTVPTVALQSSCAADLHLNNLAWWTKTYNYFRGSLRYKINVNTETADVYVWHNPMDVKNFQIASGASVKQVKEQMNFACDLALTQTQQSIEVEVPFFSGYNQLLHSHTANKVDLRAQVGTLYVAIRSSVACQFSIFISTGDDFLLNVMRAPPIVYDPAVFHSSNQRDGSAPKAYFSLEGTRQLTPTSSFVQVPGTGVVSGEDGNYDCTNPINGAPPFQVPLSAETKDFSLTQLPSEKQPTTNAVFQMMGIRGIIDNATGAAGLRQDLNEKYDADLKPALEQFQQMMKELTDTIRDFHEDVKPAILGHGKKLHKDLEDHLKVIKDAMPKLTETLEHVSAAGISHTIAAKQIGQSFATLGTGLTDLFAIIVFGSFWQALVNVFCDFSWLGVMNVICFGALLFKVKMEEILTWLWTNLQELYEEARPKATNGAACNGHTQGFEEFVSSHPDGISAVLAAVATMIYCVLFGTLPKWDQIRGVVKETVQGRQQGGIPDFLRSMHFSNMGVKAVANAYDFFSGWMKRVMDYFLEKESPEAVIEKQFKDRTDEVMHWMDEIEKFEDEDVVHMALSDVEIHNKLYMLVDQGKRFSEEILNDEASRNVSIIVRDLNKRLLDVVKRVNEIRPGHGFRYAPFVIMLDGKSGIGKSNVMHAFTEAIRQDLGIPEYNHKYSVPSTAKYLDGYQGQAIIEWDDVLQCPDQDIMLAEFINWRSNVDFIVNKAKVEEKGMHFASKAIIMSSNNADVASKLKTIRCPEAFNNRINIRFDCRLAPGYSLQQIKNYGVMIKDYPWLIFDMKVCNDGVKWDTLHSDLSFAEAITHARAHFDVWNRKQEELVANYHQNVGSLRIPRGVQLVESEDTETTSEEWTVDDVEETFSRVSREQPGVSPWGSLPSLLEQGDFLECREKIQQARDEQLKTFLEDTQQVNKFCKGNCELVCVCTRPKEITVQIEEGLTEEESIDAELFEINFIEMEPEMRWQIWKNTRAVAVYKEQVSKSSLRKYIELARKKINLHWRKFSLRVKKFYENHKTFVKGAAIVSSIIAMGWVVKSIWSMFPTVRPESGGAYEHVLAKQPTKIIRTEGAYEHVLAKQPTSVIRAEDKKEVVNPSQGCTDPEATKLMRHSIHPVMAILGWAEGAPNLLQGFAIGGKILLCPHHFFRKAVKGNFFFFLRGRDKVLVEYDPDRMQRIRDKDAVLYFIGPQFEAHKNIVNAFVKEKDLSKLGTSLDVVLAGMTLDGYNIEQTGRAKIDKCIRYGEDINIPPEYVQYGWHYDIDTQTGQCGAVLVGCSKLLQPPGKILGIHTAGYAEKRGGFSVLLTYEMITETLCTLVDRCGKQVYDAPLPLQVNANPQAFNEQVRIVPEGHFSLYGVMDNRFCPSQPVKTNIRPTPYHGELYPVAKAPAALQPVNGVSPLRKALGKYGKLTIPFSIKHIRIVKADILNELLKFDGDMLPQPTSMEVAIFGIEGMPYCERMNMRSSPGWPWQCLPNSRGKVGKTYLFDEENRKIRDELLEKYVTERESEAKEGRRFPSIWRDCMKDELRPLEKVLEGKTRLFTIAPVDFTILVRKYYLAFEQMFYKNHCKFFSAVGVNPESFEWTSAYNRLRAFGNHCMAGDFSSFDGTLMADLIYEAGEIIDEWYKIKGETDPDATLVRRVLIDEVIHTYQLVQNCVYQTHQGNPSGNPLTVIINTIVNAFYMRLAWMEIMAEKQPLLATMVAYHENVCDEAYGDDNRAVIKREVLEFYNQITVTKCLARHGIVYTDETKSGDLVPWRDLLSTSFLKRKYRTDPEIGKDIMLPQMDELTIYALTNWYRDGPDLEEQLRANQLAALGFAFFHGREFYDNFNSKLSQKMRSHGIDPHSVTYDEQLDRFLAIAHGEKSGRMVNFLDLGF